MIATTHLWWHISRVSGLVSWLFSAIAVFTGALLASKSAVKVRRSNWQTDLHRMEGAIAVAALAAHLGGLVLDSYVHFGLLDLLVPMHASWRTGAVAWGVVAMYVLLVVELTSLIKDRLPKRLWHTIHLGSFFAFVTATAHGLMAGTDASRAGILIVGIVVTAAVVGSVVARLFARPPKRFARPT
jgi:hypothetical protein